MCGFLSAIITRPGRIFANGLSGHAELAEQHIKRENGIGRQTYWEWEADPRKLPADPLQVRNGEDPPEAVRVASDRLLAELASANGFLPSLPNVAVFRDGSHGPLKSGQVAVMLGGTIDRVDGGTIGYVDGGTIDRVRGGTIDRVRGGTIGRVDGGTIDRVRGGTIGRVRGGTIGCVDGGTIGYVYGGHIGYVDGGHIDRVDGGTIDRVDGGHIGCVDGSSTVTTYTGVVLNLSDNAVQIDRSGGTPVVHVAEP